MPLQIEVQFDIVIYSILAGIVTGVLFDLYKIIRGLNVPKFLVIMEDILFWILTALIIFSFLLYINYAFLGVYVYILLFGAFLIYLKFVSPIVYKIELMVVNKVAFVTRVILKRGAYVFKMIYYNISGKSNVR